MRIKKIVEELVDEYHTRNPFEIAERMGICVTEDNLGDIQGYYILYSGVKCICLNSCIKGNKRRNIIMAHELGHSVMHEQEQFMFYQSTLYSVDKTEVQANRFAAELLIPDHVILENPGMTKRQIAGIMGFDEKIMSYKKI